MPSVFDSIQMFDFSHFMSVADHLVGHSAEGHWRSAVSRAYYAVYHSALAYATRRGYKPFADDLGLPRANLPSLARAGAHRRLVVWYTHHAHDHVRRAGLELERLLDLRQKADYEARVAVSSATASQAVQDCKDLLADITRLP